jgi:hypothetical protein
MKVSSPVGEFPFEPQRIGLEDGGLVLHGSMGAWPATVRIDPADIPSLFRVIPWPVWAGVVAVVVILRGLARR